VNKKSLAVAAVCVASCHSVMAQSQDGLTIYGVVDAGVRYIKSEANGSVTAVASGGQSATRLGFRGLESLGGGWSAGFNIENGFGTDTGIQATASTFFDRRSTVSLFHQRLGELRLGRDYAPAYSAYTRFDPFLYINIAGTSNLITGTPSGAAITPVRAAFGPLPTGAANANTTVRSNNAVEYILPSGLGGFEGQLMVAPNEGTVGGEKLYAARLGYGTGPFFVNAAMSITRVSAAGEGWFRDSVLGASYAFPAVRLAAAVREFSLGDLKQRNVLLAATIPVGSGEFKASAHRADFSGTFRGAKTDRNGVLQLSVGYVHNLSKRTSLYAQASRINNKGASNFSMPSGPGTITGGTHVTGFESGVRHSF
jgi:predicted porin